MLINSEGRSAEILSGEYEREKLEGKRNILANNMQIV
jgi:hypothetical protein